MALLPSKYFLWHNWCCKYDNETLSLYCATFDGILKWILNGNWKIEVVRKCLRDLGHLRFTTSRTREWFGAGVGPQMTFQVTWFLKTFWTVFTDMPVNWSICFKLFVPTTCPWFQRMTHLWCDVISDVIKSIRLDLLFLFQRQQKEELVQKLTSPDLE